MSVATIIEPASPYLIVGLENIGRAAGGYGPAAVKRWIAEHDLPARQLPDGRWATTPGCLDSWIMAGGRE